MPTENANLWWRPEKYDPETLLEKSREYFRKCEETFIDKGMWGVVQKPKTITGLCLHLGVSRDYIADKAKDERYSEVVSSIRLEVENSLEEGILLGAFAATPWIFLLKANHGYRDSTDQAPIQIGTTGNILLKLPEIPNELPWPT